MQDAPGTSLNDAAEPGPPDDLPPEQETSTAPAPSRVRAWALFVVVAAVLMAIDQLTKAWAVASLTPDEPRDVVGALLRFNLVRNPGAAFSTGTGFTELFTLLAAIATCVTLWFAYRTSRPVWGLAFGFLLAGIDGNLIDRLVRPPGHFSGHVIDFIELPHWPIFNVADMCINVAAVLIVVLAWRSVPLRAERARDERR